MMLDLSQFLDQWAFPLLALLLGGFSVWLVACSTRWLDAHASFLSAQTREKLEGLETRALVEGVQMLMTYANSTSQKVQIHIDNPVVRWAVQIAENHAGGYLSDHGASPDEIAVKILSRLPPEFVTTGTTGAKLVPDSVTMKSLQPIGTNQ